MKCSIVSIGTELSLGLITDTNSAFIAEKLSELGMECNYMFTVPDKKEEITRIIESSLSLSDIVITSGGLGPTDDDMTRKVIAETLGKKLVKIDDLDSTSLKFIRDKKTDQIKKRLLRQSYIPDGSMPLKPWIGSASGFRIDLDGGKYIFCIPGVPKEMRDMFTRDILPFLTELSRSGKQEGKWSSIKKSTLLTTDISETEIEEKIKDIVWEAKRDSIDIGITAAPGVIKVILVEKSGTAEEGTGNLKAYEDRICGRLGSYVYGKGNSIISENLKTAVESAGKSLTISTAESITGGLISSIITDTPGSSKFFRGGIVSYSDFVKERILKVDEQLLESKGAVSREVCIAMAQNAMSMFGTDYSLSVTGYAGPEYEGDRLGLVYCCIKGPSGYTKVFKKKFLGNRTEIKFRTTQFVLNELRNAIKKKR